MEWTDCRGRLTLLPPSRCVGGATQSQDAEWHAAPCRAPLGLPPQDGGGKTRRCINRPIDASPSAWRRRLAGRAAEKFASPPRLRVCSLCSVSLSCGSLSHLCWDFFVVFSRVFLLPQGNYTQTQSLSINHQCGFGWGWGAVLFLMSADVCV